MLHNQQQLQSLTRLAYNRRAADPPKIDSSMHDSMHCAWVYLITIVIMHKPCEHSDR